MQMKNVVDEPTQGYEGTVDDGVATEKVGALLEMPSR